MKSRKTVKVSKAEYVARKLLMNISFYSYYLVLSVLAIASVTAVFAVGIRLGLKITGF